MLLEKLSKKAEQAFRERHVGLLAFGSYFNNKNFRSDSDIDLALILSGSLDHSCYEKILYFNRSLETILVNNYKHAPFYSFTDEPNITNPFLYKLFFDGYKKIQKDLDFSILYTKVIKSLNIEEPIALTLSKEHTFFARRCLIDNILFNDLELTTNIFKNHTTTAMRMMTYLISGKFINNSYDIWQYWLRKNKILVNYNCYNQILQYLKDDYFKLDVHISIVNSIKNYQRNLQDERYNL